MAASAAGLSATLDDGFQFEEASSDLELLALEALREGDPAKAFRLADRRCRVTPLARPSSYILRADAALALGDKEAAIGSIVRALEAGPDDLAANRRMLAWGEGPARHRAARVLLQVDRDFNWLRKAIKVLKAEGIADFANVLIFATSIEGWAVWDGDDPLEIVFQNRVESIAVLLKADPRHPLGDCGRAGSLVLPRPEWPRARVILLRRTGRVFYSLALANSDARPSPPKICTMRHPRATVIVPVFGDYEATRACLESLLRALRESARYRVILVNDASPDPRLNQLLDGLQAFPFIDVLTNARNVGFVSSVNRALAQIRGGDVVLLNADTLVPPDFLDRLASIAQLSEDIGTVTPLSNNGDLAGFPVPNTVGPLGSCADVEKIDAIAATVNYQTVVDIPNGVGFCLYITRACLNAVGLLSEQFGRGYLEDVDFCLRARAHGFRNVCAPWIYVGHAGSKSFGGEKRSLVRRNLPAIESRFPNYKFEYAAFSRLDPLRRYREAIARELCLGLNRPRLIVTGAGVIAAVARERARVLAAERQVPLILEFRTGPQGRAAYLYDSSGLPQPLTFPLSSVSEQGHWVDYIRKLRPSAIEFLDPAASPLELIEPLLRLDCPYDIFVADASWLGPQELCLAATKPFRDRKSPRVDHRAANRWREIAAHAENILLPCERAGVLAQRFFSEYKLCKLAKRCSRPAALAAFSCPATNLGVLALETSAEQLWLIRGLLGALKRAHPGISFTVLGATLDDLRLMRSRDVFVAGAIDPGEIQAMERAYRLQALLVPLTRPLFGHPLLEQAFSSALPISYFDWCTDRGKLANPDLPLDPASSFEELALAIGRWTVGCFELATGSC